MRPGWLGFFFFAGIVCLLTATACRKSQTPTEPDVPAPNPISNAVSAPDFSRNALSIHHAAQEMALDGFQFGKNHLGWPYEVSANSAAGYFEKLIREGFLPSEAGEWSDQEWMIANLSDADSGETAFLKLVQPDKTILLVRKDGQWAVFRDETGAAAFAKTPSRDPAWLP
ncbi:MAG: hypothetical protein NTZ08_06520 [Verrucomicrobia bacterium]|nr:hypothetical protein [Verrucomicrobiota bacterium]